MKTLTVSEARSRLPRIADEVARDPSVAIEVTRRGRRVMTIVSAELYDSLVETLEILRDPQTMSRLRRALREAAGGRTMSWKEARKRLDDQE